MEALLDLLLCLYSECSHGPMKREKHITDFLQWGKDRVGTGTGPGWDGGVTGPEQSQNKVKTGP